MKYLIVIILFALTISPLAQETKALQEEEEVLPMSPKLRPKILHYERPLYTKEARKNRVHGAVVLTVTYAKDGMIKNVVVVKPLPDGLTESAIEAAQKMRFKPAEKEGKPVSVRGNVELNFNL